MNPLWSDGEKCAIIDIGVKSLQTFRELEFAHRVHNGLDVGKSERDEAPYDLQVWQNLGLCRLAYGDRQFLGWANAKVRFATTLLDILEQKDASLVDFYLENLPTGVVIAELLEGDFCDMVQLLKWPDRVIRAMTPVMVGEVVLFMAPLWKDDVKRMIIEAGVELMQTFRYIEYVHREDNGLDVRKRQRDQNGSSARYNAKVQNGRARLGQAFPTPTSKEPDDLESWKNGLRLRMQSGDSYFLSWSHAKVVFATEFST
ncbi:hypothetical protein GE09DRAFT_1294146 [Coniochaeta sp. 2T2.1]|nr:hypothetical protein GE09DRAFT_1294146 [Coniochaeta sp. 2T2.1]